MERGCVEDQPQRVVGANAFELFLLLRLVLRTSAVQLRKQEQLACGIELGGWRGEQVCQRNGFKG